MQVEDLKGWLQEDSREKNQVRRRWRLLVRLIRRTFEDGVVPGEVVWETMVFRRKGKGWCQVSGGRAYGGGMEVIRDGGELLTKMECYPILRTAWVQGSEGYGTATLEEKLAQKMAVIEHKPLLKLFLGMQKAYDYLDIGWCMEILRG